MLFSKELFFYVVVGILAMFGRQALAQTYPLPNPPSNNVRYFSLPETLRVGGKDMSGLRGYVIVVNDLRYLDFRVPETRISEVDCSRVFPSTAEGMDQTHCRQIVASCQDIYANNYAAERLGFPTWPLTHWFEDVNENLETYGVPKSNFMINTNHFDLRGALWPTPPQGALEESVLYDQACSKPFGAMFSNGIMMGSINSQEITAQNEIKELSDVFAFFPDGSPIKYIFADELKSSDNLHAIHTARAVIAGSLTWVLGKEYLPSATKPSSEVGRTALGINHANNRLIIVVVQTGRNRSPGLSVHQINDYLVNVFSSDVVMVLDGSGSSQLTSSEVPEIGVSGSIPYLGTKHCGNGVEACSVPGDNVSGIDQQRPIPTFLSISAPGDQITPPTVGFMSKASWSADFTNNSWGIFDTAPRFLADVDGDGKADLVGFKDNQIRVALSNGSRFGATTTWGTGFGPASDWTSYREFPIALADINGDKRADIVGFGRDGAWVAFSTGSSFGPASLVLRNFGLNQGWISNDGFPRVLADVNGDGKADIIGFGANAVWVSLSQGTTFATAQTWLQDFVPATGWDTNTRYPRFVADVNGDGRADIVGFGAHGVFVAPSNGTLFHSPTIWSTEFADWVSNNQFPRIVSDVNADGKADIIGFGSAGVHIAISTGQKFARDQIVLSDFGVAQNWSTFEAYPRFVGDVEGRSVAGIVGCSNASTFVSKSGASGMPF